MTIARVTAGGFLRKVNRRQNINDNNLSSYFIVIPLSLLFTYIYNFVFFLPAFSLTCLQHGYSPQFGHQLAVRPFSSPKMKKKRKNAMNTPLKNATKMLFEI